MNDPIAFGGFCLVIAVLIFGAYQCGFAQGLAQGFKHGRASAEKFARWKRSETQPNGNHRM